MAGQQRSPSLLGILDFVMPSLSVQIKRDHSAALNALLSKAVSQAAVESVAIPLSSLRVVSDDMHGEPVIVVSGPGETAACVDTARIRVRGEAGQSALSVALFAALNPSAKAAGR
ncbi:hypothetical protein [Pandoraea pulmonicola]|nr:hypothetical protein [Pandoraea pulmonicola]